jgi:hypothetical protein
VQAALRNHPDKNGNTPESIAKFQDINKVFFPAVLPRFERMFLQANEVLKTPWKKEICEKHVLTSEVP